MAKKPKEKKPPIALIRFTEAEAEFLYDIKRLTGIKTNTGACIRAVKVYAESFRIINLQMQEIERLQAEQLTFFTKIDAYNKAAKNLRETKYQKP